MADPYSQLNEEGITMKVFVYITSISPVKIYIIKDFYFMDL